VRRLVITLIPCFAAFDRQRFIEDAFHVAMGHLVSILEKPQERSHGKSDRVPTIFALTLVYSAAFIALGHTAVAVGNSISVYLEPIMNQIKSGFQMRGLVLWLSLTP
jgi:phosphate/sulfate permease